MLIRSPQDWQIPERLATTELSLWSRREILTAATLVTATSLSAAESSYPAKRNPSFTLDRPITPEAAATGYNNFYEFDGQNKQAVKDKVGKFVTRPWTLEVSGLVNKPRTFDIAELERTMPLEERLYRLRCVEAWSIAVPWTGFPLAEFLRRVEPKSNAKYLRFVSVRRPNEMPGIGSQPWYPWPYFEALRIDEAMNPLALLVTGMYGKPLPRQNGAPIRLIVPWKYGFKSAKSIVKIELVAKQPATFWNQLEPAEYGFYANVNPKRPHPRWSQAEEKVLPDMHKRPTLPYNGYATYVAGLYNGGEH